MIAPSCGWCRFSATFSGRIWTSRKAPIKTGGTRMNANHAMAPATVSSVSPWRNEAWARDGSARNVKATNRTKCLPRGRRDLAYERMSESFWFHGLSTRDLSVVHLQPCLCPEMRARGLVIACPGASLRSVNIRRHRSPTRGIIAVISGKNLLDFRRTRSAHISTIVPCTLTGHSESLSAINCS